MAAASKPLHGRGLQGDLVITDDETMTDDEIVDETERAAANDPSLGAGTPLHRRTRRRLKTMTSLCPLTSAASGRETTTASTMTATHPIDEEI